MLLSSACGPDPVGPGDALDASRPTESLDQIASTLAVDSARIGHALEYAKAQMARSVVELGTSDIPRSITNADGTWNLTGPAVWTSGFYSGLLWQMHELTGESSWQTRARAQIVGLESQKTNANDHDVGFKIFTSYGNAHRLTGDPAYRNVVLTAAQTLASRYSPVVGSIKSQDRRKVFGSGGRYLEYPVIIDNMMNLELLFYAYQIGGDRKLYDIAVSHALKTRTNHVRTDGGSYQYVDYDPQSGSVVWKGTHQGYSNGSTWARGQAWGIYGFAMTYRYTRDVRFLTTAKQMADYVIARLPNDNVPYWDFDLPSETGQPRDVSAAAIAGAGLIELGGYVPQPNAYRETGLQILESLSGAPYLSEGTNRRSILLHSVGNYNSNSEVDVPLIYADYYFVEALASLDGTGDDGGGGGGPGNNPPTAADVAASGDEDAPSIGWTPSVSDPDGDALTCSIASQPANGTASVSSDCSSGTYTPDANFSGQNAFAYAVSDEIASDQGTVTVTVNPANAAPVANTDAYNASVGAALGVAAPGVLGNDSDVDGDALTAELDAGPSNATSFTLNADGSFSYTSAAGDDSFTYHAFDGTVGSNVVTVAITVSGPAPGVTVASITPNSVQQNTVVDVTITGSGFLGGAAVSLHRGSGPTPVASSVVVVDGSTITATLTVKAGGPPRNRQWDVTVTNSDGSSGTLVRGFTVTP